MRLKKLSNAATVDRQFIAVDGNNFIQSDFLAVIQCQVFCLVPAVNIGDNTCGFQMPRKTALPVHNFTMFLADAPMFEPVQKFTVDGGVFVGHVVNIFIKCDNAKIIELGIFSGPSMK
jgi:hypothetical protein